VTLRAYAVDDAHVLALRLERLRPRRRFRARRCAVRQEIDRRADGVRATVFKQRRDGTECKVGSNQVNICSIRCSTDACYAANPIKEQPIWPLNGAPSRRKLLAPTDTLAPATAAPVN